MMMMRWISLALVVFALSPGVVAAQGPVNALEIYLGPSGAQGRIRGTTGGSPEGVITAVVGTVWLDTTSGLWYRKATGTGNTGWVPSSVPNGTQYCVPYFTATGTVGCSANLTFTGSVLGVIGDLRSLRGITTTTLADTRYTAKTLFVQADSNTYFGQVQVALGANAFGLWNEFVKSRSTNGSTLAIVASGDEVGRFNFAVDDGTDWQSTVARIAVEVDGTPGVNDTPGRIMFYTTAAGSSSPVERLRIDKAGLVKFSYATEQAGQTRLTGAISPTQLVANTDNWGPTGLSTANVVRINVDANRDITGIVAQATGTILLLHNTTTFTITLKHDVTSTAANRFYGPGAADYALTAYASVWIRYDGTHSRWTVIG